MEPFLKNLGFTKFLEGIRNYMMRVGTIFGHALKVELEGLSALRVQVGFLNISRVHKKKNIKKLHGFNHTSSKVFVVKPSFGKRISLYFILI